MPLYFFNTPAFADPEGEEAADDQAAWHSATLIAGELFKEIDGRFRPDNEWRLEVTDQNKKPIFEIDVIGKRL